MSREDLLQVEGTVIDVHAGGNFVIQTRNGPIISAKLSGKMRKFHIKVLLGDRVTVGVSPYDPMHGLIVHRHKGGAPDYKPTS